MSIFQYGLGFILFGCLVFGISGLLFGELIFDSIDEEYKSKFDGISLASVIIGVLLISFSLLKYLWENLP